MSHTVIKVEGLGKKYIIGHKGKTGYKTFRDQMIQHVHNFYSRTKQMITGHQILEGDEMEEFWALKDVSFEISKGDRVGIIGRNGAGKSTLLKILSRITEPTTGKITIKGRVASLLEVGTGFHPELTGRENIFLNGAILGMSRLEIRQKFDEIVDFSNVEKFLDTPVKRYSSGMYVRLAFAIAAHLEPEILIVDEVLAVGDHQFQKKCIEKMEDVNQNEGKTIIFVSHNMSIISSLCKKGILLNSGSILENSSIKKCINVYYDIINSINEKNDFKFRILEEDDLWTIGKELKIEINWPMNYFPGGCFCDVSFHTLEGIKIFAFESEKLTGGTKIPPDKNGVVFSIENIGFIGRDVRVDIGFKTEKEKYAVLIENALKLNIPEEGLYPYKVSDAIVAPRTSIKI